MDIFTHQFDMIKTMGSWEWLSRYPINPVTMVAAALVVGLVVLFANSRIRRRNAERHKPAGPPFSLSKNAMVQTGILLKT